MSASFSPSAPTIICVLCPAGAKAGAFGSSAFSSSLRRIEPIASLMVWTFFSGARRDTLSWVGSSMLTDSRSA